MLQKLIFNRTKQDVLNRTPKGFYNNSDIQRINEYIKYMSDYLNLNLTIKNDFILGQIITQEDMQLILDNIDAIRKKWYVAKDTPQTPIVVGYDYISANNVESILQALYDFAISVQTDFKYSGTFSSGQEVIL